MYLYLARVFQGAVAGALLGTGVYHLMKGDALTGSFLVGGALFASILAVLSAQEDGGR